MRIFTCNMCLHCIHDHIYHHDDHSKTRFFSKLRCSFKQVTTNLKMSLGEGCCLFCLKTFEKSLNSKHPYGVTKKSFKGASEVDDHDERGLLKQFFFLLCRHLHENKINLKTTNSILSPTFSKVTNALEPCPDCVLVIKSLCDIYNEIKILELKLNWRLGTLVNIVKCSKKVKFRMTAFQMKLGHQLREKRSGDVDIDMCQLMKEIGDLRTELVKKCALKLRSGYPKVKLTTLDPTHKIEAGIQDDLVQNDIEMASVCDQGQTTATTSSKTAFTEDLNLKVISCVLSPEVDITNSVDVNEPLTPAVEAVPRSNSILSSSSSPDNCDEITVGETKFHLQTVYETPPSEDNLSVASDRDDDVPNADFAVSSVNGVEEYMSLGAIIKSPGKKEVTSENLQDTGYIEQVMEENCSVPKLDLDATITTRNKETKKCRLDQGVDTELSLDDCYSPQESDRILPLEEGPSVKLPRQESIASEVNIVPKVEAKDGASETELFSKDIAPLRQKSRRTRHKCATCSKAFTTSTSLKSHKKTCRNSDPELNNIQKVTSTNCEEDVIPNHNDGNWLPENESPDTSEDDEEEDVKEPIDIEYEEIEFMKKIYPCKYSSPTFKCRCKFYNPEDLENHSKLHGMFKCSFCPVKRSYAPNIPVHELTHKMFHSSHGSNAKLKSRKTFLCPHCNFRTGYRCTYTAHHLERHMNLVPNQNTCHICEYKVRQHIGSHKGLAKHYRSRHVAASKGAEKIHRCDYEGCAAYFLKSSQLASHRRHHFPKSGKFKCVDCDKHFDKNSELQSHLEAWHSVMNMNYVFCTVDGCKRKFLSEKSMSIHRKCMHKLNSKNELITRAKRSKRKKIEELVTNQSDLKKLKHEGPLPYLCKEINCSEEFFTPEELERHSKFHGSFKCMFCDEVKTYAPDLSIHEVEHHTPFSKVLKRPGFLCPQCNARFRNRPNYVNHHLAHLNLPPLIETSCLICKLAFNVESEHVRQTIRSHYRKLHSLEGEDPFNCEEKGCSAYFRLPGQLKSHMNRAHFKSGKTSSTKEKPYSCPECEWICKYPFQLIDHRRVKHKSKFLFKCEKDNCSETFETELALKNHLKLHDQNLLSFCPICKKAFKAKGHLQFHMKYHEKDKPKRIRKKQDPAKKKRFLCTICGKETEVREHLKIHMLSHSGPESWRFACETCGKKCISQQKLEEHLNTHRKEDKIVFTCERCGQTYAHRHNFRHHLKNKHGIILEKPKREKKKRLLCE